MTRGEMSVLDPGASIRVSINALATELGITIGLFFAAAVLAFDAIDRRSRVELTEKHRVPEKCLPEMIWRVRVVPEVAAYPRRWCMPFFSGPMVVRALALHLIGMNVSERAGWITEAHVHFDGVAKD